MNATQTYPVKPIYLIVPGVAGGPGDIIARVIGEKLSTNLGQQVIIKQGLSQNAAVLDAARAPADGYTLVMGTGAFYINAALYRKLPFDPVKDFAPVASVASVANVLVVHPSVPVNSVAEFIAYAKKNPGKLRYGSSGRAGPPHLAGEMFSRMAGVELTHVPYKGHVAAGHALCEGRDLQVMFDAVPTAMPHINAGELKALGLTTLKRIAALPMIPTISECGVTGYELNPVMGVLAPAGTPDDILVRMANEIENVTKSPYVKSHLQSIGIETVAMSRDDFVSHRKGQFEKWAGVLKICGIESMDAPAK